MGEEWRPGAILRMVPPPLLLPILLVHRAREPSLVVQSPPLSRPRCKIPIRRVAYQTLAKAQRQRITKI